MNQEDKYIKNTLMKSLENGSLSEQEKTRVKSRLDEMLPFYSEVAQGDVSSLSQEDGSKKESEIQPLKAIVSRPVPSLKTVREILKTATCLAECTLPEGLTLGVYIITAEIAAKLLLFNVSNRNLTPFWAASIADAITAGQFKFNGAPLLFSKTGEGGDGQHRLNGVVKSGKAIQAVVITGLDPQVFLTVDIGMKRLVGQMAKMMGVKNGFLAAAAARKLDSWNQRQRFDPGRGYQQPYVAGWLFERYPVIVEDESFTLANGINSRIRAVAPSTALAVYALLQDSERRHLSRDFFDALISGQNVTKLLWNARERLIQSSQVSSKRLSTDEVGKLLIYVWNLWSERSGQQKLASMDVIRRTNKVL